MARPAKFSEELILDAASQAAVDHWRDATLAHVAALSGAPVGSIYHRFPSRDHLFVTLWLRAIRRFHAGLLDAAGLPDANEAAVATAVHLPRFCRASPHDAVAMTLYRQPDLIRDGPRSLRDEVTHINDDVTAALTALTARRYPVADQWHLELLVTACEASPYGLVRPYLRSSDPIPPWLDDVVRASTSAILQLGDDPAARKSL